MDWQIRLITLYVYVDGELDKDLWTFCQRLTNNNAPEFTDAEVAAIFLHGIMEKRFEITTIYDFARNHLSDWFPKLPSYPAFVSRINKLCNVFPALIQCVLNDFAGTDLIRGIRLIDSFPVIMAGAKRSSNAKVAAGFANKGYCASKGIWYYGVKVHILGSKRIKTLPLPEYIDFTPASEHDLSYFRQIAPYLHNCKVFADMAYIGQLEKQLLKERGL